MYMYAKKGPYCCTEVTDKCTGQTPILAKYIKLPLPSAVSDSPAPNHALRIHMYLNFCAIFDPYLECYY